MKFKTKQQGFSLFMVMILMLVIALLVMVSVQSSTTEMRMSTNEADRKFAVSLAENGLREAEGRIRQLAQGVDGEIRFRANCANGYCAAADDGTNNSMDSAYFKLDKTTNSTVPAWERCTNSTNRCDVGSTVLDSGCDTSKRCITTNDGKVHYIIEYLGNRNLSDLATDYFRVTSRARGNNQDTIVTLQTHVELQTP